MKLYIKHIITTALLVTIFSYKTSAAPDDEWGFCKGKLAYKEATYTTRKPASDWLCSTPTAKETGDAVTPNTLRCLNGQRRECEIGAGGIAGRGSHNVPRNAWYWIPGSTLKFPDVRCQCGCFDAVCRHQWLRPGGCRRSLRDCHAHDAARRLRR